MGALLSAYTQGATLDTTDNSWHDINTFDLTQYSTFTGCVTVSVIARRRSDNASAVMKQAFGFSRVSGSGSTIIGASIQQLLLQKDLAMLLSDMRIVLATSPDTLKVQVKGLASTSIEWGVVLSIDAAQEGT